MRRRRARVAQRLLELVERPLLAALAERPQRLAVALGLGPDRGDRDDLLVQPRGAGAVDGEAPHQHDARLRAGPIDHGDAREPRLEALRQEARQQPADQPVLEMDLDHVGCVAAIRQDAAARRRSRGSARACAPLADALAALARAGAQIVERILPAGVAWRRPDRSGSRRKVATLPTVSPRASSSDMPARDQRGADDALQIVADRRRRARASLRAPSADRRCSFSSALVARLLLVVHLGAGASEPLGVGLLLDRLGERRRLAAVDAARAPAAP